MGITLNNVGFSFGLDRTTMLSADKPTSCDAAGNCAFNIPCDLFVNGCESTLQMLGLIGRFLCPVLGARA